MIAFGDSITAGVAANVGCGWVARMMKNSGAAGAMALDATASVLATVPAATDKLMLMYGTNDERIYGAAKVGYFRSALQAHAAWLALASKSTGQSASITYGGTWTNLPIYGGALAKRSDQNGAMASFSITGDVLYLCTVQQDVATGTFDVTVDGASKGTFGTAAPGCATTNGATYGAKLIRIAGLGAGSHNVVVTVNSASGGNNAVYIAWAAGMSAGAQVFVSNVIRQTAAGYAVNGGSDATVDAYNAEISALVAELAADGLAVYLVDNHAALNNTTDISADGCHPSDAGHAKIYDTFWTEIG